MKLTDKDGNVISLVREWVRTFPVLGTVSVSVRTTGRGIPDRIWIRRGYGNK